ncbi:four helix bundle protein, partial [Nostoc flagelliforme]|uniref:four helix bundle protein n=1 Tax=Nostoc flagelliforme TaxID=1306274 RepID=UPI001F559CB6
MNQKISIADRTKALAIRIVKACTFLDEKPGVCRTLSKQLLRSGTSIGANVKEAQSAQSDKDFLSKLLDFGQKEVVRGNNTNKRIINLVYSYQKKKSIATRSPT